MKIVITDKHGTISFGKVVFFWFNQYFTRRGECGVEIYPIDDLDGYILLMIGSRWRNALSYDFYAFGRYYGNVRD